MIIDLRKGFGDFEEYKLFKFPDNSIKFELKNTITPVDRVITTLRSIEDVWALGLVAEVIGNYQMLRPTLSITYLMFQQDDRIFSNSESYGLKFILNYLNSLKYAEIEVFHPHNADPVEMGLKHGVIIPNDALIDWALKDFKDSVWVIPDAGAFKTQFKQIQSRNYPYFITCMKSRSRTGDIETIVNTDDLEGQNCFIIDDIALGARTHINIAKELKLKNCGELYLIVSHGVFNYGVDHILEHFDTIYTTDSICTQLESEKLKIFKLWD